MNLFDPQTEIRILFQCLLMNYVSVLIIQIWNNFFHPIYPHYLRSKQIIVLQFMKLFRILKIHLEDAWNISLVVSYPLSQ